MWRSRIGNRLPGGLCTPIVVFSSRPAYSLVEFVPRTWPRHSAPPATGGHTVHLGDRVARVINPLTCRDEVLVVQGMRSSRCSGAVPVMRVGTREGDVSQVQRLTSRSVPLRLVVNSCHVRIPVWLGLLVAEEYPISVISGEIRKLSPKSTKGWPGWPG